MDREKVIKGLECCTEKQNCNNCPYFCFNEKCQDDMNHDALALLKEQDERIKRYEKVILEYEDKAGILDP